MILPLSSRASSATCSHTRTTTCVAQHGPTWSDSISWVALRTCQNKTFTAHLPSTAASLRFHPAIHPQISSVQGWSHQLKRLVASAGNLFLLPELHHKLLRFLGLDSFRSNQDFGSFFPSEVWNWACSEQSDLPKDDRNVNGFSLPEFMYSI